MVVAVPCARAGPPLGAACRVGTRKALKVVALAPQRGESLPREDKSLSRQLANVGLSAYASLHRVSADPPRLRVPPVHAGGAPGEGLALHDCHTLPCCTNVATDLALYRETRCRRLALRNV
jgi:hypothetical protein